MGDRLRLVGVLCTMRWTSKTHSCLQKLCGTVFCHKTWGGALWLYKNLGTSLGVSSSTMIASVFCLIPLFLANWVLGASSSYPTTTVTCLPVDNDDDPIDAKDCKSATRLFKAKNGMVNVDSKLMERNCHSCSLLISSQMTQFPSEWVQIGVSKAFQKCAKAPINVTIADPSEGSKQIVLTLEKGIDPGSCGNA
ncbi:hypothetical protein O181_035760 [Austropuccinia psidii MF-1]|uniref:Uncharacterized protein n=1 Tax=Austropuccinia psidii MF-1 TaxID=1389203 RepID=A0A9Q3HBH5_9BASI|nr:hypothetical protein [Austropuccinia psidii MF-1]